MKMAILLSVTHQVLKTKIRGQKGTSQNVLVNPSFAVEDSEALKDCVFSQWPSGESQESRGSGMEFFLLYHCTCWLISMLHYHPCRVISPSCSPAPSPEVPLPGSLVPWTSVGFDQWLAWAREWRAGKNGMKVGLLQVLSAPGSFLALSVPLHNYGFCQIILTGAVLIMLLRSFPLPL